MGGGIDDEDQEFNRTEMLKAFDETKAGVKGLIDSGRLPELSKIFMRPSEELIQDHLTTTLKIHQVVPVIDLTDVQKNPDRRKQIVEQVRAASETWGFFQVVNHGIPSEVVDGMIDGVERFNDMDVEQKKKYYSRDHTRSVRYDSSYDLFTSRTASWRDTLTISFNSGTESQDPHDLPPTCRESVMEYSKNMEVLGNSVLGLLSEALGLETAHLKNMECCRGHRLCSHYYPACPLPELAIGTTKHSDVGFFTILVQNQICSGLQVLYEGQWIDIHPIPGALVVNIGDLLQLVSNGIFKSNEHRAKANEIGPRISVACFFSGPPNGDKTYGPIEELLMNPPVYREIVLGEYRSKFYTTGLDNYRALHYYML
ncbi:hypothetical protein ACS0TY_014447 [Phlomoides rotata]